MLAKKLILAVIPVLLLMSSPPSPAATSVLQMPIGDPARRDRQVELRLDGITDSSSGELITPQQLAERLEGVALLFIGESHTTIDFHRVQLRVIQELHRAGRQVLVGLEMFPYTQQATLDGWTAGHYTEAGFVELAEWYRYWGYNWAYYRDIFLYARDQGIPMFGINTPREVVAAIRRKGFDGLTPEEAAHVPVEIQPASDEMRQMYTAFFDPDDAMHIGAEALEGMLRAQTTWDATMGWNALQALKQHGGEDAIMVVLIGSGHVTYGLGAERQLSPWYEGQIASLIPVPVQDDAGKPVDRVQASYANFLWGIAREQDTLYPSVGVSLMGPLGELPSTIIQVGKGSVAERAGLRVRDVLLALDGQPVASTTDLRRLEAAYRWGDVARARIRRDRQELDLEIEFRRASPQ